VTEAKRARGLGRVLRRVLAFLLSLLVMTAFYLVAVMMENEETRRSERFLVEAAAAQLLKIEPVESADGRLLARAFGAALPLPEGLGSGRVESGAYHGYITRTVSLEGTAARVTGVRPASAAPGIMPPEAVFMATDRALMGVPLLRAREEGQDVYALMTGEAAFLIRPHAPPDAGGFIPTEP